MNLYSQFGTNKQAESDGVRIVYGSQNEDGAPAFTISRMNSRNRAYQQRMELKMRPFKRQIDNGTISPEKTEEVVMSVFVETVLKGWENVKDEKGKALEFSTENAIKLFTDLPDLYTDLLDQAQRAETFRLEDLDETVKK